MAFPQRVLSTLMLVATVITTTLATDCVSGDIDAIAETSDGHTYAFAGAYVARLNSGGSAIESGYPKLISDVFPGLPTHIDAAIHWPNGKTYFFKGDRYWRTSGTSPDSDYPKPIAWYWPGMPDSDLDAAVIWPNGKAYIFRGSRYWRYDVSSDQMDCGYPKPIEGHWPGYSDSVDAAILWNSGASYLFNGEQYWRYNPAEDEVETKYTYPKATTKNWFGCPTNDANVDMAGVPLFN